MFSNISYFPVCVHHSLREELKAGTDKVQSLTVDLQRRDDDSSDLKEKLADSKKQFQQVQKEVSPRVIKPYTMS